MLKLPTSGIIMVLHDGGRHIVFKVKRVELFIREEDQEEKIYCIESGIKELVDSKYKNPSLRRGGIVVEYTSGSITTIAQHKGDMVIVQKSAITGDEFETEIYPAHFLDVIVYGLSGLIIHCNPEKSDLYRFEQRNLDIPNDLNVVVRIEDEVGYNILEFCPHEHPKKIVEWWHDEVRTNWEE